MAKKAPKPPKKPLRPSAKEARKRRAARAAGGRGICTAAENRIGECLSFASRPSSEKSDVYVTQRMDGSPLYPVPKTQKKACTPSKNKPLGVCRTEIVFLGEKGPHIRHCIAVGKPGPLVAVKDHREAKILGDKFCAAVRGASATKRASIVKQLLKSGAPLGGMRRRKWRW